MLAGKSVYSMVQRGEVTAFKVREQRRVRRADIEMRMKRQAKAASEAR
jgi:hypothetical protein